MSEFNFKSQVCTSRVQSERLLSLGLKKETADMCWIEEWGYDDDKRETFCTGNYFVRPINYVWDDEYINYIPAWSLHRLIEMALRDILICGISFTFNEDAYEKVIRIIEHQIKEEYFPKGYLNKE